MSSIIAVESILPNSDFDASWEAIKISSQIRERLVAQSLLALAIRQSVAFETIPLHGLILLSGPPGTGKTTLARGIANQVAKALPGEKTLFLQIDPHALASSALGKSQREMTKLFQQTLPESADNNPCIVLLDEVETLIADRNRLSLETNPVDVHRSTDAALAGLDLITRNHKNILFIATTNFPKALDQALFSRADWIEQIDLPDQEGREAIMRDVFEKMSLKWPQMKKLLPDVSKIATLTDGYDGRRLRKLIVAAAAQSKKTAQNLNFLTMTEIVTAIENTKTQPRGEYYESKT